MARLPRLTVPGQVHHIIQRGNNRQPIFQSTADHELLLELLAAHAREHQVALHAYLLLGSQFQLLATPETGTGIPLLMQAVGRGYVRQFNLRHGRSGTLWEGRYRSNLIQAERYLLPCMVALDLAPVREGVAQGPADYPWSSHAHYIGRRVDRLVTAHPTCWSLGNTPFAREETYGLLVQAGIGQDEERALTDSALQGWVLGDPAYVAALQSKTERRLVRRRAGRRPTPINEPVPK